MKVAHFGSSGLFDIIEKLNLKKGSSSTTLNNNNFGRRASITPHAHSRGRMIWESPPESILIIRKLDYDTTQPFIEVSTLFIFYLYFFIILFIFEVRTLREAQWNHPDCRVSVDVDWSFYFILVRWFKRILLKHSVELFGIVRLHCINDVLCIFIYTIFVTFRRYYRHHQAFS